ncbi:MAG: hypothetical protein FWG81_04485 [Betaproteobacteria bacterium]|nr:hypothetical protein [Betaproteobacteria bacterium]
MRPLFRFATSVGICALAGPLVGFAAFVVFFLVAADVTPYQLFNSNVFQFQFFLFLIASAYVVGGLPAGVVGILFGAIIAKYNLGMVQATIVGFIVGVAITTLFYGWFIIEWHSLGGWRYKWDMGTFRWTRDAFLALILSGAASGAICGLFVGLVVRGRRTDNSPTPDALTRIC